MTITLESVHRMGQDQLGTLLAGNGGPAVRIYSREHLAYWRPKGAGYALDARDAAVVSFSAALAATQHCGPEKGIEYEVVEA